MEEERREMTYRFYISNCLQNIPQNKYIKKSLYDILYPCPEDTRTGEEIALDIIEKAGLMFGGS